MDIFNLIIILFLLTGLGYWFGRRRALAATSGGGVRALHSLPVYYGLYVAMWCGLPALLFVLIWTGFDGVVLTRLMAAQLPDNIRELSPDQFRLWLTDAKNLAKGKIMSGAVDPTIQAAAEHYQRLMQINRMALFVLGVAVAMVGAVFAFRRIHPAMQARIRVERSVEWFLLICSMLAIFTTVGIFLSVLFESIRFFEKVPVQEFLFGLNWSPQTAIREGQVGASGTFGAVPLFAGTFLISAIAMAVAAPIGLLAAIYLSEYAGRRLRGVAKPALEILAGIPTVVYGFFAALVVAPFFREWGERIGLDVASESALAAGLVMGIMIIPFVSSLSDDVINAVPQSLRDGAYALGATQSETVRQVVFPAALPGIIGGLLLAVSRAIGETMIVVMAAGVAANLTINPLEAVTTVTVQIVTLLTGDQAFDSAKTLAAFALGLVLFLLTLLLNVIALHIVRKYREQYE